MSQAVQIQVNGVAVSESNPLPITTVTAFVSGGTPVRSTVEYRRFTSTVGNQTLTIAQGAVEVNIANTGTATAFFTTTSMVTSTELYPISTMGAEITLRAPNGGTLEQIMVTADVGQTIEYLVIR